MGTTYSLQAMLEERLERKKALLDHLYDAWDAIVLNGVKSYRIDDRELTRLSIPDLKKQIDELEEEVEELETRLEGRRARKAFGIIPRDW